jgi:hypothetical protein
MSLSTQHSLPPTVTEPAKQAAQADPNIRYEPLENNIHEFVFLSNQPQGVTKWAQIVGDIIEQMPATETMRQLLDVRKGVAPLSHLANEIRGLQRKYSLQPKSRLAVLSESSFAPTLFNVLISLLPTSNTKVHYFKPHERDVALRWLLDND